MTWREYQEQLGVPAERERPVGTDHYQVHRERSRGWSAVIAGGFLAALVIGTVGYALAVRAADAASVASAWVR